MLLSLELIETINNKLTNILNLDFSEWSKIDKDLKIKILHNLCSKLKRNSPVIQKELKLSLKSLKPKKFIQFCGFSKLICKEKYEIFLSKVLDYTFEFRKKYVNLKKRKYFTYSNLPNDEYNQIINDYNELVYNFIIENIDKIKVVNLYNLLLGNNKDKIILLDDNDKKKIKLEKYDNSIKIYFGDNVLILLNLIITSNSITNNIPVLYNVNLINNY